MSDDDRLMELLLRWEEQFEEGRDVPADELCRGCPELAGALAARIADLKRLAWMHTPGSGEGGQEPSPLPSDGQSPPRSMSPAAEARPSYRMGQEAAPGYRLIERRGRGTFGEVWAANATALGRIVAVKLLHGSLDVPLHRRMAEAELEGLTRIRNMQHPNVLEILHLEVNGATLLVVTELADRSLEQHFSERARYCTPPERCVLAMSLLGWAAKALDHLQRHGLMHLDVKPGNLLLVLGTCKLADFGTVKQMRAGGAAREEVLLACGPDGDLTRTTKRYRRRRDVPWREAMHPQATLYTAAGAFTPYYASPEMLTQGRPSRFSDQYSLALTFCQLAAGRIPFNGEPAEQMSQRSKGEMDLGLLPESLRSTVARALSPEPQDRFPSCVDFVQALYDALPSEVRLRHLRLDLLPLPGEAGDAATADARPKADRTAARRSSGTIRRVVEKPPEADPPAAEGPESCARPIWNMTIKSVVVLFFVLFAPILALHMMLRWGTWLAGRVVLAKRGERRLVCVLVLALACAPALILSIWAERIAPISAALKGPKDGEPDGSSPAASPPAADQQPSRPLVPDFFSAHPSGADGGVRRRCKAGRERHRRGAMTGRQGCAARPREDTRRFGSGR